MDYDLCLNMDTHAYTVYDEGTIQIASHIDAMLAPYWANVVDVGPVLNQHWVCLSSSLGSNKCYTRSSIKPFVTHGIWLSK